MATKRKSEYPNSKFSKTSLNVPEFEVSGPWDDREPLIWIRCSLCGCTNRYEEGDSECTEILEKGFGLRRIQRYCRCNCSCNCHTGQTPLPTLKVKREVG